MNIWTFLAESVLNVSVWRISEWTMEAVFVILDFDCREPGSDLTAIFKMTPVGIDGPLLEEMGREARGALILLKQDLISASLLGVVNGEVDGVGLPLIPLFESLYCLASPAHFVAGLTLRISHNLEISDSVNAFLPSGYRSLVLQHDVLIGDVAQAGDKRLVDDPEITFGPSHKTLDHIWVPAP